MRLTFNSFQSRDVQGSLTYHNINVKTDESGEFTAELSITINKSSVELWWPNGYGRQSLYGLKLKWEDQRVNEVSRRNRAFYITSKTIKIGFRTVELVQTPMNNGLSFFFKINGIPMFTKGSNWIPVHILPEKTASQEKFI
jgi:beta-mannosidase